MNTIEKILAWSQKELPLWQQDAVRRILAQQSIDKTDIAELYAMLRSTVGMLRDGETAPTPIAAKADNIPGAGNASRSVRIHRMAELKNVNAIPDGRYLAFSPDNLTVIYGQNGSGKSGYARVLKKACRARDTKEQIHPNVFKEAAVGPAEAKFTIAIDGTTHPDLPWQDGKDSPSGLDLVSVFDSRGAKVIVDEDNEVTYLPQGAEVFPRLGEILRSIEECLHSECTSTPELNYLGINVNSTIYTLLQGLSADSSLDAIQNSLTWTPEDESILEAKRNRIRELQSPDVHKKIARLTRCKETVLKLKESLLTLGTELNKYSAETLRKKLSALKTAKDNFDNATKGFDPTKEPLPGVGGEAWQALYEAARTFSEVAYHGKTYPAHEVGDKCVFCMQDLSEEARSRFKRFIALMDQQPKTVLEHAQKDWAHVSEKVNDLKLPDLSNLAELLEELKDIDPKLHTAINETRLFQTQQIDILKRIVAGDTTVQPKEAAETDSILFDTQAEKFEASCNLLSTELKPEELARVQSEKIELESRKAANQKLDSIKEFIYTLKLQKKIENARKQLDLKRITSGGKSIISKELVKELVEHLKAELALIGADYLPLEIKGIGSDGDLFQKLVFSRAKLPKGAKLTDVLSEGEQRVVAIAGFLAELAIGHDFNPVVFDDPVSSLDHRFREAIAERIVKEAKARQMIVFTHDITFLLALNTAAQKIGVTIHQQTVRRQGEISGVTNDGAPWEGMTTGQKLEVLEKKLTKAKAHYPSDIDAYNSAAAEIYGLLREAWETFVEDRILNKTVKSHRATVMTQSLLAVEVTTKDYVVIDDGMTKCSKWMPGHRKSPEVAGDRPAPTEILADIQSLQKADAERGRANEKRQKDRKTELGK